MPSRFFLLQSPFAGRPSWNGVGLGDGFNGNGINRDNWRFDQGGWGWGNGESQFYTDRPQNARVVDGMLVIEAWEEEYPARTTPLLVC